MRVRLVTSMALPPPADHGTQSLEQALRCRRSVRDFDAVAAPLSLREVSQLLFAAQGATFREDGALRRTVPSAGALFPLEVALVAGTNCVEARHHCWLMLLADDPQ